MNLLAGKVVFELTYYWVSLMSTDAADVKPGDRRAARRIGVEEGADFDERRRIILVEASKAFNERGFANTSLDDIAARLKVTKPALYHYVKGKEDLIDQCIALSIKENRTFLRRAAEVRGSGLDKLRFVFSQWATHIITPFGRSMVRVDLNSLSEENQRKHRQVQRLVLDSIEDIIRQGMEDGSIRTCNPAVITLSLLGLFNSPARWFREDGALSIDEVVEELMSLMERGLAL